MGQRATMPSGVSERRDEAREFGCSEAQTRISAPRHARVQAAVHDAYVLQASRSSRVRITTAFAAMSTTHASSSAAAAPPFVQVKSDASCIHEGKLIANATPRTNDALHAKATGQMLTNIINPEASRAEEQRLSFAEQ